MILRQSAMKSICLADGVSRPSQTTFDLRVIAMQITVTRYGARHWAVHLNGQLLAVTVYKKGALAVQDALRFHPNLSRQVLHSATETAN